jgi:dolichol-phosphate mannosyltransferase
MLIPPPKYTVDRLVPCQMTDAPRVRELFIIERGAPRLADLDKHAALSQLLANTDDAYGFPPFRYLAPAISIGSRDYHELRAAERNILAGFLANVRVRTLASDTFGWADKIPHLIGASDSGSAGAPGNGAPDSFSWAEESPRLIRASDSRSPCASGDGAGAPRISSEAPPSLAARWMA